MNSHGAQATSGDARALIAEVGHAQQPQGGRRRRSTRRKANRRRRSSRRR